MTEPAIHAERERLRLFVAVLLPEAWLDALARVQRRLREAKLPLRYVRAEGIHLTLNFLGDTAPSRLPAIRDALGRAAGDASAVGLKLGRIGTFGPAHRPRVLWCGVNGEVSRLAALQQAIGDALADAGVARESRPYSPHLTLARVPDRLESDDMARIAPVVAGIDLTAPPFIARSIALMRSELDRGGARYTRLAEWTLHEARSD